MEVFVSLAKSLEAVPFSRIFLWLDNPRHIPFDTEAKAIEFLCEKEDVYPLARDIAKHGLNPLERMAIFPTDKRKPTKSDASYYVAEGNRRICAVKLLHDPDLAPANLRKAFEKLSEKWTPINSISAAVFNSVDDVKLWLDRVHNGPQGGVGRRQWHSEQKTRFDGGNKNKAAQALLDYAEAEKMISAEDRKGKLTTVQRFLTNDVFREALGFDQTNPDEPARTRSKAEFDLLLKRFMHDLVGKENVNSRMNKEEIKKYARPLNNLAGLTTTRVEPESLISDSPIAGGKKKPRKKVPKKPEKVKHVAYDEEIFQALRSLGNGKLESLYHSICNIDLDPHTPIIAVGAWSFFETLTVCGGRKDSISFPDYLSKSKLVTFGLGEKTAALREAITRVSGYGNTTKHHPVSATFNGDQLNNDFLALRSVILKCIEEAANTAT
jgi:hypothetical protein